jgi:hypothetical protein
MLGVAYQKPTVTLFPCLLCKYSPEKDLINNLKAKKIISAVFVSITTTDFEKWIRNTLNFLKCGAGEGRISDGLRVKIKEVLQSVKGEKIPHRIKCRKVNCVVTSCEATAL